jgi:hypothetical protein
MHRELSLEVQRVVGSGSLGGWLPELRGDLRLVVPPVGLLVCEVKARREVPRTLARWLADNDALFIRGDREQPVVVLPWSTWIRIIKALQDTDERTTP